MVDVLFQIFLVYMIVITLDAQLNVFATVNASTLTQFIF